MAEEVEEVTGFRTQYSVWVSGYDHLAPRPGVGIVGQPAPHLDVHRPLSALFSACFDAGFVLDGLEEPAFGPEVESEHPLNWAHSKDIPPSLAARMRLGA